MSAYTVDSPWVRRECEQCASSFWALCRTAKYCSSSCRSKAFRDRTAQAKVNAEMAKWFDDQEAADPPICGGVIS